MKTLKKMKTWRFASFAAMFLLTMSLLPSGNAESGNTKSNRGHINDLNLSEIDRNSWKLLEPHIKIPVYRTFSREKKQVFWRQKHEELKKLNWDQAELAHIDLLYSAICENPVSMERGVQSDEIEDRFEIFLYNWKEHARDVLGWNARQMYAVAGTGDEVLNIRGELKVYTPISPGIRFEHGTRAFNDDCPACPKTGEMALFPYPGHCNYFYMCFMGTAIAQKCPDGLLFDYFFLRCDWPESVWCE